MKEEEKMLWGGIAAAASLAVAGSLIKSRYPTAGAATQASATIPAVLAAYGVYKLILGKAEEKEKCSQVFLVVDESDNPIEGAYVTVNDGIQTVGSCYTGSDGKCTVTPLLKDKIYYVDVSKEGYICEACPLELVACITPPQKVVLKRGGITLLKLELSKP